MQIQDFCCKKMQNLINDPLSPLEYEPARRSYCLVTVPRALRKQNELSVAFFIQYCPLCSSKLPEDLSEAWSAIIKKEFGLSGLITEKQKKLIPQEFKTDEWWKKRGL